MTTSSSSQKKKTQVIADLIPNNYEEQPGLIEGKTKVFKDQYDLGKISLDILKKINTKYTYGSLNYPSFPSPSSSEEVS